ncbi:hypothetical protein POM88_001521 [Heracleum sosnowskyi]|uniref:DUF4218 domain-containing protein n=1 Tax=Heracleum sosnowskyi TaxID=360622 RepID=A0AAD8JDU3_9APIA|nr:hypothetical protein POM88_001521 [Heracleum sosnowskyi]
MDNEENTWIKLPKFSDGYIRGVLHPVISSDGKYREIRAAIFDMTNREKEIFCSVLEKAKLPYGCAANISRYVHTKERTIWGYKSHDAHFLLHYLLQFAVKKTLKPEVALPLIRLGAFLRSLGSKVFTLADLNRLEQEIIEILCHFEMIFPSAFFDIMIHLLKPKSVEEKSAQKSALIKNSQGIDENVDLKSGSVRRKLDLHNSIDAGKDVDEGEDVDGDENMDENDMEDDVLPPPPPLSPSSPIKPMKLSKYEMIKFLNMERNRQRCRALGVPELAVGVSAAFKKDKGKSKGKKNIRDEDEYIEESEEQSEDDASEILPKKTQKVKKNKVLNGPTTRSRSNAVTTTENGSTQNDKNEAAANSGMVEPAKTQLPCCQGLGSMVDYLAMRERKQKEAASAIATGSGTKNDKVPETDLPDIEMEEVEAVKVPKRLRGKTRMDKKNKQPDDEQPDDQQPDDQQPDGEQPDGEQPDDDLYYAKIFAKTRKRKPGRKYQSNPDVMEFRIDTINKKLGSSEGLDGLDELVSGAKKSHGRGWLIGRHDPKCLKTSTSAPAPTDSYVQELTKKIRQEVAVEVEAKVNQKVCAEVDGKINRKVQDNLTLALKKLAEANPTLNVDIGEICATISSDTVGDGTPMTNGPSS